MLDKLKQLLCRHKFKGRKMSNKPFKKLICKKCGIVKIEEL